jgi:hypothetical protein
MSGFLNLHQQRLPLRLALLLLCAALLFVQTLGQLHRATHERAHEPSAALSAEVFNVDQTVDVGAIPPSVVEPGILGLFKDHQDLPKCQLFDGVSSAQALTSTPSFETETARGLLVSKRYNILVVERLSLTFQARAPPYA